MRVDTDGNLRDKFYPQKGKLVNKWLLKFEGKERKHIEIYDSKFNSYSVELNNTHCDSTRTCAVCCREMHIR